MRFGPRVSKPSPAAGRGLLEVEIEGYIGVVWDFEISLSHKSEMEQGREEC